MWEAKSPSDPGPGLKFKAEDLAQAHAERMNFLLETFDSDDTWNKSYWKSLPEKWQVKKL